MTEAAILAIPKFENFFTIECDASIVAFGGVLSEEGNPIAYFSERLNDAKKRYGTYGK